MPPSPSIPPPAVDASAAPPASGRVVAVEATEEDTTGRLIKNGLSTIFGCCVVSCKVCKKSFTS